MGNSDSLLESLQDPINTLKNKLCTKIRYNMNFLTVEDKLCIAGEMYKKDTNKQTSHKNIICLICLFLTIELSSLMI